jgi:hypothetical protein
MRHLHPEKTASKKAVEWAVKSGKLERLSWCQVCGKAMGEKKTEAHHGSYAKEHQLDVVWLCHHHHMQLHAWLDDKKKRKGECSGS